MPLIKFQGPHDASHQPQVLYVCGDQNVDVNANAPQASGLAIKQMLGFQPLSQNFPPLLCTFSGLVENYFPFAKQILTASFPLPYEV